MSVSEFWRAGFQRGKEGEPRGAVCLRMRRFALLCLGLCLLAACSTTPSPAPAPRLPEQRFRIKDEETYLFGDSANPLTDERISGFRQLTGKLPVYWGRYLCNSNSQYDMVPDELDVFRRSGVKPILILQPGQYSLSGGADEAVNAARCFKSQLDALSAFGNFAFPDDRMIFLDVEKGTRLSATYLEALVAELQSDGVLGGNARFGIYLSGGYSSDIRALINAEIANHLPISVVWIARYLSSCGPPPYWQENNIPELGTINLSEELWQYAASCHGSYAAGFDLNAVKPPVYAW